MPYDFFSLDYLEGFFCKANQISCKVSNGVEIRYNHCKKINKYEIFHTLFNQPFAYLLYQRKSLALHASALEINKNGFLFMGLSGSGKSYFVSKMLKNGMFLSEDITRITFENGFAFANPSHPLLKLDGSKESDNKYLTFNSKLPFDKRKRKSFLINHESISKKSVKIKACFLLNFSDNFSIKKLDDTKSFALMLQSSFKSNPIFSSKKNDIAIDTLIAKMISDVEFYVVNRKKNSNNNVKNLYDFLSERFL